MTNCSQHTKNVRPVGYIQVHAWAEKKSKRHYQVQCDECGRWDIWKRKPKIASATGGSADPLNPTPTVVAKLASIMAHYEEFLSPTGHDFDQAAFISLVEDHEIQAWVAAMRDNGLMPVKR